MVMASAALALVIGAAFVVLLVAVDDLRDTTRLSRHSQEVLANANELERLVVDLESGQRGFVLTGDERFLDPWRAARLAIPGVSAGLLRLTVVRSQHDRALRIARGVSSYVRDYSVPLVAAAQRDEASARSLSRALAGKRRVDGLRAQFALLVAAEDRLGAARQDHADSATRKAVLAVTLGFAGSMLLIFSFSGYTARAIVRPVRRAAAMAGRLAGGDLSVRMDEKGTAEIGDLERSFNTMGSSLEASREELHLLADEQAALRRVATLVARAGAPTEVFDAVTVEVSRLLGAALTTLLRYESDATTTVLGVRGAASLALVVGDRPPLRADGVAGTVLRTGRAARIDDITEHGHGVVTAQAYERELHSAIGAPIVVEGRLWGAMVAAWERGVSLSDDTEARLAQFTELVATAVANVNSRAELAASRARVVAAGDETRRRIERDLHDGAQQRLVSLALEVRAAQASVPPGLDQVERQLAGVADGLAGAVQNLQEISRGIHPAILTEGGLEPALKTLSRRSAVPVQLDVHSDRRLPQQVERAAYYVVSEALTNAAKHARASVVHVEVRADDEIVTVTIRDDGAGGADPRAGSGLIGLTDRVEALGGRLEISSPAGEGTELRISMPVADSG
jgi:signal transduction histidine kinase